MMAASPVCVWNLAAELGEGPVWSPRDQMLWFVDIKQQRLHRFDPRSGAGHSWDAPAAPGFLARSERGDLIVGLKSGLHRFDADTGAFALFAEVEPESPGNRLNDGAVDPSGRLWFGSMDDAEVAPSGRLYRLGAGGPVALDDGYVITNGPAFSPDGRTLYHTDTLEQAIYAFDMAADGTIIGKWLFARIEPGAGYPDGPAVDAEGCLWTGLFGGWGLRRYSPAGELLETVDFPCANVTKLAFGGPDLTTAYATTAWKGLSAAERAAQPLAGGLFSFTLEVPGLRPMEVRDV